MDINSKTYHVKRLLQRSSTSLADAIGRNSYTPGQYQITSLPVSNKELALEFDNYRMVQLSDIHLGFWMTPQRLHGLISEVNQQNPDLVVLTGDFVSYMIDPYLPILQKEFARLNPPDGVIAILGNHDHWLGANKVISMLAKAGIKYLANDVVSIKKNRSKLHVAGLDDAMVDKADLKELMKKMPDDTHPAIMLAHEPDMADEVAATGRFFLQLSGHSHGGQIGFPFANKIIKGPWFKKYPVGRYQVGDMVQYTNRGVGTNTFRFRIFCPPEITIIKLSAQ
jgi:predicted MPP superfamily phosphohydrolase